MRKMLEGGLTLTITDSKFRVVFANRVQVYAPGASTLKPNVLRVGLRTLVEGALWYCEHDR